MFRLIIKEMQIKATHFPPNNGKFVETESRLILLGAGKQGNVA